MTHLETLPRTDRDAVQAPEPQAPVDHVWSVVPLSLHLLEAGMNILQIISFLPFSIIIDSISLQNIVPFLGLLDAGVGGQAELLQPGQVGDVGEVPQLGQLVIREAEAGHRAREVSRALAEMLFSYYFLVMYV